VLNVHYDPESRAGFVRLREGRTVRTRRLSSQALAEYGRNGRLLAISLEDVDPSAAEFLRTADEETLLQVIERQTHAAARPAEGGAARPRRSRRRSG
jgi:uncharacterized protein YuzE